MFNRLDNILTVKGLPCFPRYSAITKKWLMATTVLWIYVLSPCLGESASPDPPHLSTETAHGYFLVSVILDKDTIDNLIGAETWVLMYGNQDTLKNIPEGISGFIKLSPHISILSKEMIDKATNQSSQNSKNEPVNETDWHDIILVLLGSLGTVVGFVTYHFTVGRG